jgi:hypothetical protein
MILHLHYIRGAVKGHDLTEESGEYPENHSNMGMTMKPSYTIWLDMHHRHLSSAESLETQNSKEGNVWLKLYSSIGL